MTENMKKTTDQLVSEFLDIRDMLKELEAQKKALDKMLKQMTSAGPIELSDGRTVETVTTTREIVDTNALKAAGLFDSYKKESIINTLKIK